MSAGFFFFVISLSSSQFIYSAVVFGLALTAWLIFHVSTTEKLNARNISYVLSVSGILMGLTVFFVFGVEQLAFPRGGILFHYEAISGSFLIILFSSLPPVLFYLVQDRPPNIVQEKSQEEPPSEPQPQQDYDSNKWEEATEKELESGQFEIA